jgi:hypothetical protein
MAYTIANILTFVVGIAFMYTSYRIIRDGREDTTVFLISAIIGAGLVFVSLFPDFFVFLAPLLGLELKARAILVVSNLTLFGLVTYLFTQIERLSRNISRLNEELALLRASVEKDQAERPVNSEDDD